MKVVFGAPCSSKNYLLNINQSYIVVGEGLVAARTTTAG
jgi:hypothetical protein